MIKRKPQRTAYFYIILFGLTLLSVTSCVFNNNKKEESILDAVKNSSTTKENSFSNLDAKLLAEFKEENIILIRYCEKIKENNFSNDLNNYADEIINVQNKITDSVDKIAKDKLIIIPSNTNLKDLRNIENTDFTNLEYSYLDTTYKIISKQIERLELLSEKSEDIDIKILAIQTNAKLQSTLLKTENLKSYNP